MAIEIRKLANTTEAEICAHMMANSEPWLTLRRDYALSYKLLTDSLREVYVATREDEIVGFIMLLLRGAFTGYVQTICVAPTVRNLGIGSQLLTFAEERIFREMPNVFLCVSSFNADAQRLYARLGYETIGVIKDYLVAGYDEILLRKTRGAVVGYKK